MRVPFLPVLVAAVWSSAAAQLQPFTLPWDDTTPGAVPPGLFNPVPAGSKGFIAIDELGHYREGDRRIRFNGVNIGAADCFPDKATAEKVAARLAKFGLNNVRFHHMEAPWVSDRVLVDYPRGNSRELNPDRLDRLHYFIAKLKEKGIYTNINLLVSRRFNRHDGLPAEIEENSVPNWTWKEQHIVALFNDAALDLHKEFATKLLTAPNPYTGLPIGRDPGVSNLEVMNENGIVQKWREGVLDAMPALFRGQLNQRWNTWLASRHASTSALLSAWRAVDEPLGQDVIVNGSFGNGITGWNGEQHQGAAASFTAVNEGGRQAVRIDVSRAGSESWHVQFNQSGHSLEKGRVYTVSFWAKASTAVNLSTVIGRTGPSDYSAVQTLGDVALTSEWRKLTATFVAGVTERALRINFGGLGSRVATVHLSDVKWQTGGKVGGLPDGASLEARNVPSVPLAPSAGAVSLEQRTDWVRFLLDLDTRYWTAMRDHLKVTLGFPGIVWGTIISNSPPNVQAVFPAIDSHAYWQHPQFPGAAWDPNNWILRPEPMVNSFSNAITGLAKQRVKGLPHNVTEYQHASPNPFGGDAPLFAAAFGALQDWDGVWYFAYNTNGTNHINEYFDHGGHPAKMVNTLLAASLFVRGDVAPARREHILRFTPEIELEVVANRGSAWSVADGSHVGIPNTTTLVNRVSLAVGPDAKGLETPPPAPSGNVLVSDNGQLTWDLSRPGRGVVTANTPATKAIWGFGDGRTFDLGGFVFAPGATRLSGWFTAGLTVVAGRDLSDPAGFRAVLAVTGEVENTGQIWKTAERTSLSTWGTGPTRVEAVPLDLTLPLPASRVSAWALDGRGARTTALAVSDVGGRTRLSTGNSGATLWYEIVVSADPVPTPPTFLSQPTAAVTAPGGGFTLSAQVAAHPSPTYVWRRNGEVLPETGPVLRVSSATAMDAGWYTLTATNPAGEAASLPTRVHVGAVDGGALRIANLSARGDALGGNRILIPGFVLTGSGQKELLIRAVGPELKRRFGLAESLSDPALEIFRQGESVPFLRRDDWSPAEVGDAFARVGAFDFPAGGSKDAAVRLTLGPGAYTAQVRGADGGVGVALVEMYDMGDAPGSSVRLSNLSTRGNVGSGASVLIAGIVVEGSAPKRVLVRAAGPVLRQFGVDEALADPRIDLHRITNAGPVLLAANDDWWDQPARTEIRSAAAGLGAFPFELGAKDSALLLYLEPGSHTATVSGVLGDTGVALVEVYELP